MSTVTNPVFVKVWRLEAKLLVSCLFVNKYAGAKEAELEDLFPEDYYLSAVKEAYPTVALDFEPEEKKVECVKKRVEALFVRSKVGFENWRPAKLILERINAGKIPPDGRPAVTVQPFFD